MAYYYLSVQIDYNSFSVCVSYDEFMNVIDVLSDMNRIKKVEREEYKSPLLTTEYYYITPDGTTRYIGYSLLTKGQDK